MKKKILLLTIVMAMIMGLSGSALARKQCRPQQLLPGISSQLSEEQLSEVNSVKVQLIEEGATRMQIHAAVEEKLVAFGVEVPDNFGERRRGQRHHQNRPAPMLNILADLNSDQRNAVLDKMKEMHDIGDKQQEMRVEIHKMLEGYGVQPPCRIP